MTPTENYYHSKWKKIANVMKHQDLKVSKIAKAGSRARQQQTPKSDMDVIFSVSGDPSRENFYPKLMKVLKNNFPNDQIYPGEHYNVVHLNFHDGGKFDIVQLKSNDFDREHGDNVEYRKKYL